MKILFTLFLSLASLATIAQTPSNTVIAEKITNLFIRKQDLAEITNVDENDMRIILDGKQIFSIHYDSKQSEVSMFLQTPQQFSLKGEYFKLTPQQNSKLLAIYLKTFKAYQIASSRKRQRAASELDKL